jgi:hypothetical protein
MQTSPWIGALATCFLATSTSAQSQPPHASATVYWLSAAAGVSHLFDDDYPLGETGAGLAAAASIQHHSLVASLRSTLSRAGGRSGWDLGLLGGLGSPARYPVRGSIAAGLGLAGGAGKSAGVTLPVELQLSWRLTPGIGLGTYVFANFGGPVGALGAAFGVQVGRLR